MNKYLIQEYGYFGKEFDNRDIMEEYVVNESEVIDVINEYSFLENYDKGRAINDFNKNKCFDEVSSFAGDWDEHNMRGLSCIEVNKFFDKEMAKLNNYYNKRVTELRSLLEEQ